MVLMVNQNMIMTTMTMADLINTRMIQMEGIIMIGKMV